MDDPVVEVEHESKSAVTVDTGTASTELPTTTIAIGDIVIGKRFRRTLGRLETLVCSIREVGLLHPIVVTADRRLVAGQRRLEACRTLGWTEIPVRVVDLEDLLRAEHAPERVAAADHARGPERAAGDVERREARVGHAAHAGRGAAGH